MSISVKICGLTDPDSVDAAVEGGADYIGFVFFDKSPRHIQPEAAAELSDGSPEDVSKVGLFVDPDDDQLDRVLSQVRLDVLQLHGEETPERIDAIRLAYGVPVMKVIGVADLTDIGIADRYADHADMLLFDAKPPAGSDRPGGNATAFPWDLMDAYTGTLPWLLAGGLTPDNVAEAIATAGAPGVDVSSGVESAPGRKDPALIKAFLKAAEVAGREVKSS